MRRSRLFTALGAVTGTIGLALTGVVAAAPAAAETTVESIDFDDSTLGSWQQSGGGASTLTYVPNGDGLAVQINDRSADYVGIQSAEGAFTPGSSYTVSIKVKLAEGTPDTSARFVMKPDYTWGGNATVTASDWTTLTATYEPSDATKTFQLYIGTGDIAGLTSYTYLLDDLTITTESAPTEIQDLPSLAATMGDTNMGVAIDARETTGLASELLLKHFNQITGENHMKPEAWYDEERNFRPHPDAIAMLDFAQQNDIDVYGHVLVWHGQVPAWFFLDDAGQPLPADEAGKQTLRDRMKAHIDNVADWIASEYGSFGSDTNPLVAFDVVNEVVNDGGENVDGLRESEWYRILGEEFIDDAFLYANEAFNVRNAAAGAERPVKLFINDYNTEQTGKQDRYFALVQRLLGRGIPVDGVGHQFHVSLDTPIASLDAALDRFEALGVEQAVTEFDAATGTPVTQAKLIDQGYFFKDAFDVFRQHDLFSVTVWGISDNRSWRYDGGAPTLFDEQLQAKPAYFGAAGGELPAKLRSANVFGSDVALDPAAPEWLRVSANTLSGGESFRALWSAGTLSVRVDVPGGDASTAVEVQVGDSVYTVRGDSTGDVPVKATVTAEGVQIAAEVPIGDAVQSDIIDADVRVVGGGSWNSAGYLSPLTLIEPLSFVEVVETATAPTIDGVVDAGLWDAANVVTTGKQIEGTDSASANVRTLWNGSTLYVLAEVTDAQIDVSGSDPWIQDSVEIYVDGGNAKNGAYRPDDTQIRISATNVTSFGTGDVAAQQARLTSATATTDGGYIVEAAISLLSYGGVGTFHGLDFQVNDGTAGTRTGIRNWADPTGAGYSSTAHWGVGQLVAAPVVEPPCVKPGKPNKGDAHKPCFPVKPGKPAAGAEG